MSDSNNSTPKDLNDKLNLALSNLLHGQPDFDNFKKLLQEFTEVTGTTPKTYEEIRKEYEVNLENDVQTMQREYKNELIKKLFENSEINCSWEFENMHINEKEDPDYAAAVNICKQWVDKFPQFDKNIRVVHEETKTVDYHEPGALLLLYGDYGVGKSMLAGAMAHKLMREQQRSVEFMQWHTIFEELQLRRNNFTEYKNFENTLVKADLLIIDEVAVDKLSLTDPQRRELGELLRSRKNLGKCTILITNLNPQSLYESVGQFCWESIKNYANFVVVYAGNHNKRANNVGGFDDLRVQAQRNYNNKEQINSNNVKQINQTDNGYNNDKFKVTDNSTVPSTPSPNMNISAAPDGDYAYNPNNYDMRNYNPNAIQQYNSTSQPYANNSQSINNLNNALDTNYTHVQSNIQNVNYTNMNNNQINSSQNTFVNVNGNNLNRSIDANNKLHSQQNNNNNNNVNIRLCQNIGSKY